MAIRKELIDELITADSGGNLAGPDGLVGTDEGSGGADAGR